ncbi:MAG TPA: 50S ribosomal protein L25, partial [Bacteroidota bacterium]|nr:50S ribosomal protein L25 [Bacteroidota bacterium]
MSEITLTAEVRKAFGRRAKTLRTVGKVPGVYYGHGQQNIAVTLLEASLRPLYTTTATHIINLKLDDGSSHLCVLRDVQLDPVTEKPVHFDLLGLNENEKVTIEVPVKITGGIPKGVRDGGILQQVLHKLRISCLPKHIPDHVEINVSDLAINHSVHVKDISIPNVTIVESETSSIVGVVPPTVQKEAEAATATTAAAAPAEGAAATPAEPEV